MNTNNENAKKMGVETTKFCKKKKITGGRNNPKVSK